MPPPLCGDNDGDNDDEDDNHEDNTDKDYVDDDDHDNTSPCFSASQHFVYDEHELDSDEYDNKMILFGNWFFNSGLPLPLCLTPH